MNDEKLKTRHCRGCGALTSFRTEEGEPECSLCSNLRENPHIAEAEAERRRHAKAAKARRFATNPKNRRMLETLVISMFATMGTGTAKAAATSLLTQRMFEDAMAQPPEPPPGRIRRAARWARAELRSRRDWARRKWDSL